MLEAFVGPRPDGYECSHLDGDPLNNALPNLAWETHADNMAHKREHGTIVRGERVNTARLTPAQVRELRELRRLGWTLARLAERYGISTSAVWYIVTERNWTAVA